MTNLLVVVAPESVGSTPTGRRRQLSRNYDDIRCKSTHIFKACRMAPRQFTSKTVGTAESNISKWVKGEAQIVEKAAANVTMDLVKNYRPRAWFPKAEREMYVLFRAKRKRGLKLSTLWLCVTITGLIKKLHRDDPRAGTFTPTRHYVGKWTKTFRVATTRRSNSKNQSVEERLPKIQRFHKSLRGLMQSTAPVSRGSNGAGAGGVSGIASPGAGESGGTGSVGASGEGHVHADKKYGLFLLDRRVNVDQVRTSISDLYISFVIIFVVSLRFRMPSVVCFS